MLSPIKKVFFASPSLHDLIENNSWDKVVARIESHPNDCRKLAPFMVDDTKRVCKGLPLHRALCQAAPMLVIRALLDAYPESIRFLETGYQRSPLQVALMHGAPGKLVSLLLRRDSDNKTTVMQQDTLGRTAMHYALCNFCTVSVFDALYKVAPETLSITDHRGWMPLHLLCGTMHVLEFGVVERAVEAYSLALLHRGDDNLTPYELAQQALRVPEHLVKLCAQVRQFVATKTMEEEEEDKRRRDVIRVPYLTKEDGGGDKKKAKTTKGDSSM